MKTNDFIKTALVGKRVEEAIETLKAFGYTDAEIHTEIEPHNHTVKKLKFCLGSLIIPYWVATIKDNIVVDVKEQK